MSPETWCPGPPSPALILFVQKPLWLGVFPPMLPQRRTIGLFALPRCSINETGDRGAELPPLSVGSPSAVVRKIIMY
jgi:hypothetical protein